MPAPKGHTFSIGNSGKPKKWKTAESLQKDVNLYFKKQDDNNKTLLTKDGKKVEINEPLPYTVEGLCIFLECNRETILNYEKQKGYEKYFGIIVNAKKKIFNSWVERGITGQYNCNFTKFVMVNNTDYKDSQEIKSDNKNETTIKFDKQKVKKFGDELRDNL